MKEKKRKAGRPKLPKGQVKHVVAVRFSDDHLRQVEAMAKEANQSTSEWIRNRVFWKDVSDDSVKGLKDELRIARNIGIALAQKSKNSQLHDLVIALHRAESLVDSLGFEISMSHNEKGP